MQEAEKTYLGQESCGLEFACQYVTSLTRRLHIRPRGPVVGYPIKSQ